MPNECINRVTITSSSPDDISTIFDTVIAGLHDLQINQQPCAND